MIKRKLIALLSLVNISSVMSQASYTKLDSLSSIISQFQKHNEGKTFTGADGSEYELSFVENNFYVLSYNRLAAYSEYRKYKDKEVLCITENIDLSKAFGLEAINGNGQSIKLIFPEDYLKTVVYEKGMPVDTLFTDHLDFYLLSESTLSLDNIYGDRYRSVAALCHLMQIEKGMTDKKAVSLADENFETFLKNADITNGLSAYKVFFDAYANNTFKPLYYNEVINRYEPVKKEYDAVYRFADSVSNRYRFKPDLSRPEFLSYCTDISLYQFKSAYSATMPSYPYPSLWYNRDFSSRKKGNTWLQGVSAYITDNNGKVISYTWNLENNKAPFTQHQAFFEKIKQQIIKTVPAIFVSTPKKSNDIFDQQRVIVAVPKPGGAGEIAYYISYKVMKVFDSYNVLVQFNTERSLAEW